MRENLKLYIDGTWVSPIEDGDIVELTDPATDEVSGRVAMGGVADVNKAVAAARRAFETFSTTTPEERADLLDRIFSEYQKRAEDMAQAITAELGSPINVSRNMHVAMGLAQFSVAAQALRSYSFVEHRGATEIRREPIGVAGLITPWNYPALQPAGKTASAIAAGCTVVLKPAQLTPFSGVILAEIMEAAGVPAGVFNLVNGRGSIIGNALASHPDVDMISFTGSGPAATSVVIAAAPTAKHVVTELGGKSPQIILPGADRASAVQIAVDSVMSNTGQTCGATTRTLVPRAELEDYLTALKTGVEALTVGDPHREDVYMGPLVSDEQWKTVQHYIQSGIDSGARLVTGGLGKPDGLEAGHFTKPTIFAGVTNDMPVAREEIFGPVMSVIAYDTVDEAIAIANDSPYGLAGVINGTDAQQTHDVAARLRIGYVVVNDPPFDPTAPWGGYKASGNGREWGAEGIGEYLETKAVISTFA